MDLKLTNTNYCATVIKINKLISLENCNNVQAAIILGNQVIVSNNVKEGDKGLFFIPETQLSKEFLYWNNLYRKSELNEIQTEKGYFEENGRVRCQKFRGNNSEGFYIPLYSLNAFLSEEEINSLVPGDEFNVVKGKGLTETEICKKYIPKNTKTSGAPGSKQGKKPKESRIVDGQFHFHQDTSLLFKNLHMIDPLSLVSVTYKLHGTSGISSRIFCKKKLKVIPRFLKWLGADIVTSEYDNIYSSRKVIKNADINPNAKHFYDFDIWQHAHNSVKYALQDGMTLYYEVVGYLPTGAMIQKDYDYGYTNPLEDYSPQDAVKYFEEGDHYGVYIYRITYTSPSGQVYEFSAKQVQQYCKKMGLKVVPELFYGFAGDLFPSVDINDIEDIDKWRNQFLVEIRNNFNNKQCYMCNNNVPEEGCVIRVEDIDLKVYKQKSLLFLERETKQLDKGEEDIETAN